MKKVQDIINAMTDDELREFLLIREEHLKEKEMPIIVVNEVKFKCTEWWNSKTKKDNITLESLQEGQDDWVDVEDLTELRVWEYNELVDKLNKHYPDYPIEYLEGRFV